MVEQGVARLAGEGFGKQDSELPIDILASVLLEWLISRKKLPADWSKRLAAIQAKAKECIKDVPAAVLQKARGGPDGPLDYFRAVDIRDALAAGGERTLFGGLAGNAAVWDKIVKAYEKGAVYIGEASLAMVHNAEYEIPYLRKQAARLNQQIMDADRKQAEYTRNAQTCAVAFQQDCKKIGIASTGNIKRELHALSAQVPQVCASVVEAARAEPIGDAMRHYQDFTQYAHSTPNASEPLLATLLEVREGRTAPPSAADTAPACAAGSTAGRAEAAGGGLEAGGGGGAAVGAADGVDDGGVNWDIDLGGEGDGAGGDAGGISWDVEDVDVGESGNGMDGQQGEGGISWDVGAEVGGGRDGGGGQSEEAGISWDVGVIEGGAEAERWGIGVEGVGLQGSAAAADGGCAALGQATGEDGSGLGSGGASAGADAIAAPAGASVDGGGGAGCSGGMQEAQTWPHGVAAHRLACDGEYRMRLLDDLEELRAFIVQRYIDAKSSGSDLLTAALPESIQAVDVGSLRRMLEATEAASAALKGERLRQLLMLAGSQRFLERMTTALERKAGQEAKLLTAAKEVEARRNEAKLQLMALAPKVAELVGRTRLCKASVEQGLSVMLRRRVNVLGEFNNVISHTGL